MPAPAAPLYTHIAARIASDPVYLGLATFLRVLPILAPYVPAVTLVKTDLTLGTGTLGSVDATVVPTSGFDPVTGQYKILVPPPAGGWTWNYDGASPAPPVTVYGYALVDKATGNVLMGVTDRLNPGILLTGPGLVILDEFSFLLLLPPLV